MHSSYSMPYRLARISSLQRVSLCTKEPQGLDQSRTCSSINILKSRKLTRHHLDFIERILCKMLSRSWKRIPRNWIIITRYFIEVNETISSKTNTPLTIITHDIVTLQLTSRTGPNFSDNLNDQASEHLQISNISSPYH